MDPLDSSLLIDMAFWQSWLEEEGHESMTIDELMSLRNSMAPLVADALAYYLEHREAPELQEEG
jgi:hypothetical protein